MKLSLTATLLLLWISSPIAAAEVDDVFQRLVRVSQQSKRTASEAARKPLRDADIRLGNWSCMGRSPDVATASARRHDGKER